MAGIRTAGKAFPASTTLVTLNRAVAVSKVHGAAAALALIEPHSERLQGYFHFFGLKGAMLREPGRTEEARVAFDQAIALAKTAAEAAHIRKYLDHLDDPDAAKYCVKSG